MLTRLKGGLTFRTTAGFWPKTLPHDFYKHHRTIDRRNTMKKSWLNTLSAAGAVGTMLALSATMDSASMGPGAPAAGTMRALSATMVAGPARQRPAPDRQPSWRIARAWC